MEIYLHRNGQQQGPYAKEQLKELNVTADTPVWYDGLGDWTRASEAPETAFLFEQTTPPPFGGAASQADQAHQSYARAMYDAESKPRCPDNNLVWAILTTVLCCIPFGVVAIIKATSVNDKYNRGDYDGAEKAAKSARTWCIVGVISSIVVWSLYIIIYAAIFSGLLVI
jgi:hypothetical protein